MTRKPIRELVIGIGVWVAIAAVVWVIKSIWGPPVAMAVLVTSLFWFFVWVSK